MSVDANTLFHSVPLDCIWGNFTFYDILSDKHSYTDDAK